MKTILITCLTALALTAYSSAAEYFVAPNGSDSNPGTKSSPLRTIQHSADLAQPGDVITVHEGTYRERINPPRGGTSDDKRIVYQAAPGEGWKQYVASPAKLEGNVEAILAKLTLEEKTAMCLGAAGAESGSSGSSEPVDWRNAQWVGLPEERIRPAEQAQDEGVPLGNWLWNHEGSRFYLRKRFVLREGSAVQRAWLRIEADNRFDVWVNGKPVTLPHEVKSWRDLPPLEITKLVQPGENLINIRALETDTPDWFMSALRGGVRVEFGNAPPLVLATDRTWKMTEITWPKIFLGGGFSETKWITPAFHDEVEPDICQEIHPRLTRRSWMGRREFKVMGPVTQARIYATARGLYEIYLNGEKVDQDLLTPDHLPGRYQYQTYDVTGLLRPGKNCLSALVGGGYANTAGHSRLMAVPPLLLLQMEITGSDGRTEVVTTDTSWKVAPSPLVEDSIQFGERYDARLEQPGWQLAGFDDSLWASGAGSPIHEPVEPQECETVRLIAEVEARKVAKPAPGVFVFDYGTNSSGRVGLKVRGARRGDRIVIRYGESLGPDGRVDNGPYQNVIWPDDPQARFKVRNIDVYWCKGDAEELYHPRFCYTGFRYAQLEGYPGKPESDALIKRVFHTATPERGTFECSDPLLNAIWAAARNSWTSNLHGAPTDCPTREKQHWEDVGVQVSRTAMWYMESDRVLARWLTKGTRLGGCTGWKDLDIEIPWLLHVFSGDRGLMERHWPVMQSLVNSKLRRLKNGLYDGSEQRQWLDHTALDKSAPEIFCSAFLWRNLDLMQKMAALLGKTEDASRYAAQRGKLGESIQARLFDPATHEYRNGTQTAQLLPLAFGIVPDSERAGVVDSLIANIEKRGGKLSTGMTGAKFLLPVLSANGQHEVALRLAQSTEMPSWGHWIKMGGTAMAETWDALDRKGAGKKRVSFNHPNYGSIGEWFFEYLAGIQPDEEQPGFDHFFVRPCVGGNLNWVTAEFRSPHGQITSSWKKEKGTLKMDVTVPLGSSATVRVPGRDVRAVGPVERIADDGGAAAFRIGPGRHEFHSTLSEKKESP